VGNTAVTYTLAAPSNITAGTPIFLSVSGLTNTSTAGSYLSATADFSGTTQDDAYATNSVVFGQTDTAVAVTVPQSLTFDNSAATITLLPIPGGGPVTTQARLSVQTNAGEGYSVDVDATEFTTSAGGVLPEASPSGQTSPPAGGLWSSATLTGSADGAVLAAAWSEPAVGFPQSPAVLWSATGPTGNTADTANITISASATFAIPAGTYTGTITYTVTPNY
jgi:hypothetical protein